MQEKRKTCSKVAEYYYNEQEFYKEGCDTDRVVFELDKLCKQGICQISIDKLRSMVSKKYPDISERRLSEIIRWAKNPKDQYVDVEDGMITIKPK